MKYTLQGDMWAREALQSAKYAIFEIIIYAEMVIAFMKHYKRK